MFYASNLTTLLHDALSPQARAQALINSEFLLPASDVSSLLRNTSFTDSLQCIITTQTGDFLGNTTLSEGCGSVESIFHSWPNFYTCSWYPSLEKTYEESSLNSTNHDILAKLGVSEGIQGLSTNISSSVANCLNDYCQSSSTCMTLDRQNSCALSSLLISNGSSQILNRTSAFACLRDNVCATTTEVNPDIGGLGVIVSLLVQYSISLFALLLHGLFYLTYRLTRTHPQNAATTTETPAFKTYRDHLSTLTSALVEFQKSQCFFASTLQIASLVILPTFSVGLHGKDKILLRLTSANAFAPITLSLAHIQLLSSRNSTYLLLLSSLTFALGSAAYWFSLPYYGGGLEYLKYEAPKVAIMSCGDVAPFAPCYVQNEFYVSKMWPGDTGIFYAGPGERTGLAVWILSLGVLLYRIIAAFWEAGYGLNPKARLAYDRILMGAGKLKTRLTEIRAPQFLRVVLDNGVVSTSRDRVKKFSKALLVFLGKGSSWLHIQLFLGTAALLMQLVSAIQVLMLSANIIATDMGFGQIVAVGIWVPVLLEYGYLGIVGASEGAKYRLKAPLVVSDGLSDEPPDAEDSEPKTSSIEEGLSRRRRFPTI